MKTMNEILQSEKRKQGEGRLNYILMILAYVFVFILIPELVKLLIK